MTNCSYGCFRRIPPDAQHRIRRDVAGERQPSVSTAGRVPGQENRLDGIRFRLIGVRETVTSREEVRPMNAVTMWVLPLVFTVER